MLNSFFVDDQKRKSEHEVDFEKSMKKYFQLSKRCLQASKLCKCNLCSVGRLGLQKTFSCFSRRDTCVHFRLRFNKMT